jgi:hypothetical protein
VAKQTAIALRAESPSRPRAVEQNRPPIRMYAEIVPRGQVQYMHARQNLKRQRNRVVKRAEPAIVFLPRSAVV